MSTDAYAKLIDNLRVGFNNLLSDVQELGRYNREAEKKNKEATNNLMKEHQADIHRIETKLNAIDSKLNGISMALNKLAWQLTDKEATETSTWDEGTWVDGASSPQVEGQTQDTTQAEAQDAPQNKLKE